MTWTLDRMTEEQSYNLSDNLDSVTSYLPYCEGTFVVLTLCETFVLLHCVESMIVHSYISKSEDFHVTVTTQINKSVVYFIVRRNVKFGCSEC